MHIASTDSYTGKQGYPPTYTQTHTQALRWILACDRGEGLGYAAGQQGYLSVL